MITVKTTEPTLQSDRQIVSRRSVLGDLRFGFPTPLDFRHSPAREDVARTGAFSNQFIEGMKLLYELEPIIKLKPYLTNQWEKRGNSVKTAS